MRYAEARYGEHAICAGKFDPGDTVTIQLLDLATDTLVPLDLALCTESAQFPGLFVWNASNITLPYPTGVHQLMYRMQNVAGREHLGKPVIGGYPSDSAKRRFQGAIHIDVTNGVAGTAWDIGTPENPSNNVPDARVIADRENIPAYKIRGSVTVTTAHQDWSFEGVEPADDYVTFSGGASAAGSQFLTIGVRGDLVGAITCKECLIGSSGGTVTGLRGTFTTCGFDGTIRPAPAPARIQGLDLASQNANPIGGGTVLDFDNALCIVLGEFKGLWVIRNIINPAAIVAMAGAGLDLTLESTVNGGQFILLGTGELHDDSTSVASMADGLIRGSRVDVATSTRAAAIDLDAVAADVERLYGRNARTRLWYADQQLVSGQGGALRNVPSGVASHMESQVKTDVAPDWSGPITFYVVFNYAASADASTPPASAQPAASAPTDGSFSTEPYPA